MASKMRSSNQLPNKVDEKNKEKATEQQDAKEKVAEYTSVSDFLSLSFEDLLREPVSVSHLMEKNDSQVKENQETAYNTGDEISEDALLDLDFEALFNVPVSILRRKDEDEDESEELNLVQSVENQGNSLYSFNAALLDDNSFDREFNAVETNPTTFKLEIKVIQISQEELPVVSAATNDRPTTPMFYIGAFQEATIVGDPKFITGNIFNREDNLLDKAARPGADGFDRFDVLSRLDSEAIKEQVVGTNKFIITTKEGNTLQFFTGPEEDNELGDFIFTFNNSIAHQDNPHNVPLEEINATIDVERILELIQNSPENEELSGNDQVVDNDGNIDFSFFEVFPYFIRDTDGDVSIGNIVIKIADEIPVANQDNNQANETLHYITGSEIITGNILANDSLGMDSSIVTKVNETETINNDIITSPTQYGSIEVNVRTGAYTYTLDVEKTETIVQGTEFIDDEISYRITDTDGDSAVSTLTVTIDLNQLPIANDDTGVTDEKTLVDSENSSLVDSVLNNDTDPDNQPALGILDTQTVVKVNNQNPNDGDNFNLTLPSGALLIMQPNGHYQYDPNGKFDWLAEGEDTNDTFSYTVADAAGLTDSADVTLNIAGVNDVPTIVGVSVFSGEVTERETAFSEDLTETGLIKFADVDLTDTHTVEVNFDKTDYTEKLGNLVASIDKAATDGEVGEINWSYTLDNQSVQFLAQGESIEEIYKVTIIDNNGGEVEREVAVTIEGTNDVPTIVADSVFSGEVTERETAFSEDLTETGLIKFEDVDLSDTHNVEVDFEQSTYTQQLGQLVANIAENATDGEVGEINWTYTLDNQSVQFLAQGESIEEIYKVTIIDNNGGEVKRDVTVTIKGTNDVPTIVADSEFSGEVTERETAFSEDLTETGSIKFADVDLSDTHNVEVDFEQSTYTQQLGQLVVNIAEAATDGAVGEINWTYTLDNQSVQFLAQGESIEEIYKVTIIDNNGGEVEREVAVTIQGTNDVPTIVVDSEFSGEVTERETAFSEDLTETGLIKFEDIDLTDTHTVKVDFHKSVYDLDQLYQLGQLDANIAEAATDGEVGEINWTYTLDNQSVQFLAQGEFIEEIYKVTIIDNNGGEVEREVAVTIQGSNDAPMITTEVLSAQLAEDANVSNTYLKVVV